MRVYVVDEVPSDKKEVGSPKHLYYVHKEGYPYIPVFGSIGTKQKAVIICKQYNLDGKAHFVRR